MPSFSVSRRQIITKSSDNKSVFETRDWTLVEAFLSWDADGADHFLVIGGGAGYRMAAGDSRRLFLAPGTSIDVETSSSSNVEWSFIFTQVDAISLVDQALGAIHRQLDDIRCGAGLAAGAPAAAQQGSPEAGKSGEEEESALDFFRDEPVATKSPTPSQPDVDGGGNVLDTVRQAATTSPTRTTTRTTSPTRTTTRTAATTSPTQTVRRTTSPTRISRRTFTRTSYTRFR